MTTKFTPFIVYALDTPYFPPGEMWAYDHFAPKDRVRYTCQKQTDSLEGSLIILSGGCLIESGKMEGLQSEQTMMWMDGCLDMKDRPGERFAENAIPEMLDPDARVTMVLYVSRDEAADHLDTVRQAGFEVIVTGDVTPGFASNYAVCLGNVRMLKKYEWLSQVWPYEPFFFLSNTGPQSSIEKAIINAATNKTDPEAAAVNLLNEVEKAPDNAEEILGHHYLRIGLTDPEMKSLLIMRGDPDVSNIEKLFHRTAKDIGISLYDAGNLRVPDSEGRYFTEFHSWDREVIMPERWSKVIP